MADIGVAFLVKDEQDGSECVVEVYKFIDYYVCTIESERLSTEIANAIAVKAVR